MFIVLPLSVLTSSQAVKWAIGHGVKVISMSWSIDRTDVNEAYIESLGEQIKAAAAAKIIMFCAAADEGRYFDRNARLYPYSADTGYIRLVGSARESGDSSDFVDPHQVDYLFPGEDIKELNGHDGSSAATALAAGFAALVLWCFQECPPDEGARAVAEPTGMHDIFVSLQPSDVGLDNLRNKWVNVTTTLGNKGTAKKKAFVNACAAAAKLRVGSGKPKGR